MEGVDSLSVALVDWAGWVLLALSFPLITVAREVRRDTKVAVALWAILAAHHTVALTNAHLVSLPFEPDAARFHALATELASPGWSLSYGSALFVQVLGTIYHALGPSLLLGQELSILAFAGSCVVLLKLMYFLAIERYRVPLLLLYGLLPPMLIVTSMIMREAYQILFFMLTVYFALRFHERPHVRTLLGTVGSALGMGILHKGLVFYAPFLIALVMLWRFGPRQRSVLWAVPKIRSIAFAATGITLLAIILTVSTGALGNAGVLTVALEGDLLTYAEGYRSGLVQHGGRTTYAVQFDLSSPWRALLSLPALYGYYHLSPFPWQIASPLDAYGFFEVCLRLSLLVFAILSMKRSHGPRRRLTQLFLLLYLSMTALWAIGTSNYGTAARHHLLTNWILLLTGGPPLLMFLRTALGASVPPVREGGMVRGRT